MSIISQTTYVSSAVRPLPKAAVNTKSNIPTHNDAQHARLYQIVFYLSIMALMGSLAVIAIDWLYLYPRLDIAAISPGSSGTLSVAADTTEQIRNLQIALDIEKQKVNSITQQHLQLMSDDQSLKNRLNERELEYNKLLGKYRQVNALYAELLLFKQTAIRDVYEVCHNDPDCIDRFLDDK